ncbi:MAG: hypothetical protein Q7T46_02495 [Polaromonas sp.]|nr:hypothetical protein [Polaromonas sp.]
MLTFLTTTNFIFWVSALHTRLGVSNCDFQDYGAKRCIRKYHFNPATHPIKR